MKKEGQEKQGGPSSILLREEAPKFGQFGHCHKYGVERAHGGKFGCTCVTSIRK